MGTKRKANVMTGDENIKIVADPTMQPAMSEEGDVAEGEAVLTEAAPVKTKKARVRSGKYVAVRAQIDKTKKYDSFAAVELIKKLSYTSFAGTVTAHLVVKETGMSAAVTLPHSTGKTLRVAIVDEAVLKAIEEGKIEFDILLAEPQFMPKLAKFASVLGPKGLMPNPKNGTVTPKPEVQKKKLEGGTVTLKTEKKAPLLHVQIGKTSMETKQLVENLDTLIKAFNTKLVRVSVAATMSPGIKVNFVA
jgi:large subunit ribosomal protein L1